MSLGSSDLAFMLENRSPNQKTVVSSTTKKKEIKKRSTQSCEKHFKHDRPFPIINFSHLLNLKDNSYSLNIVVCVVIFGSSW